MLSREEKLNDDSMLDIMMEQKKPEKNDITLSGEKLRKYFPRSYRPPPCRSCDSRFEWPPQPHLRMSRRQA